METCLPYSWVMCKDICMMLLITVNIIMEKSRMVRTVFLGKMPINILQ